MSKKTITRTDKPLSSKPAPKIDDTAYLLREDLDDQQEHPRQAGAGTNALKAPAPAAEPGLTAGPATMPPKPLAPLAALWPSSPSLKDQAKPPQAPASRPQKTPTASAVAKAPLAPATPSPQPPAQSGPPASREESAAVAPAPFPTAPKKVNVNFALLKPDAKRVALVGEFNGWSPSATPMKRSIDGHWETTLALAPGRYQYKFIVDEEWLPDPAAQKSVPNQYGSLNSVIEVRD